ncbi:HAD family hydrolase [Desulfatiglans anilini]|uniref:HAD family hydrolase n=1 Tax=Desulfatiglans anilini TaxID=90728 RepID=UPI0004116E54|nr:HAD family hydrolase [Desulfatiglans anilini]
MTLKPAIIFDCDGVLFDSREANIAYYNHLLAHFELPPLSPEDVPYVHMHTTERSIRRIFRNSPYLEAALAYRREVDSRPFIEKMAMERDLKEILQTLRLNFRLAVATNRTGSIHDVLDAFDLREFFSLVVSSLDVINPKPHPEPLLKILQAFDLEPGMAAYVGDSTVDSETAAAAGVPFVAYRNPSITTPWHAERLRVLPSLIQDLLPFSRTNPKNAP